MAEQDRQNFSDGELFAENVPSTPVEMGEEEGIDGEIDDIEEAEEATVFDKNRRIREFPSTNRKIDSDKDKADTERHRTSSDHRRHRHHGSSHRDRRRRPGGHTEHFYGIEGRSGRLKQRPENIDESPFDSGIARVSPKKHSKSSSKHIHGYSHNHHSKPSSDDSDNGELPESQVRMTVTKDQISSTKKTLKENRDDVRIPKKGLAEGCEAEDGEILEDGELSDDDAEVGKNGKDSRKDIFEATSSITSVKGEKPERKKSDHKSKRKHEADVKRKKEKYADKLEDDNSPAPAPAWGSGYQGPKKKAPPFSNKEQRYGAGSKGYHSPPGLYDSPSYSEESDEESVPKSLLTEGYIDASVAADEKEGIFNHKVNLTKKSKRHFERADRKRMRNSEGKKEGPPKKKSLTDKSDRPACKFYLEGKCAKGGFCQFNHDVEKPRKMEVCKYHLTVKGCIRDQCQYMHEDFPCKYYHTGAKCYSGDNCKFSHDPLTEETKRALGMRVAVEDIIDMEDPDYGFEYSRQRETHNRPSLLGSPPRFRPDVKKIPSLFEIEVHPPSQTPKPSPQAIRPPVFYSETNLSPKPGLAGGPMNSPNVGIMNNASSGNQNSQQGVGGPGLLQLPIRPGSMNAGPIGNNRPAMMMGTQQALNPQQQRLGAAPSIQFLGPGQINNNNQQPQLPVLNMLGAIIREAAMQGSGNQNMNMVPNFGMNINNIRQSMAPNMNTVGPNVQENVNMGPNMAHNNIMSNSTGNIPATNMSPMNIGLNNIGNMNPNNIMGNIGPNGNLGNMGPNSSMGNVGSNSGVGNIGPNGSIGPNSSMGSVGVLGGLISNHNIANSQQNIAQEDCSMDVDYRIGRKFEDMKEENQDLHELDKIRQQIQAQIDREDEEEGDAADNSDEDVKMQIADKQISSDGSDGSHEKEEGKSNKTSTEAEVDNIEIPEHLPKKQKELFKRIQQQQLLRAKELERQEALKIAEDAETKAETDDWYSSDEDVNCEKKPKLTDVLKSLNSEPSKLSTETLPFSSSSSAPTVAPPPAASAFNIMQMINAIKSQSAASVNTPASKPVSENLGASLSNMSANLGLSQASHEHQETSSSPASPPPVSVSFMKLSAPQTTTSSLHLPALTVDPAVISAQPAKPLTYSVVKLALDMPKPYTQLPPSVNASDPAFKDDPRVRWYLNYLEKQGPKESQRRESSDGERPQKQSDPRLKKGQTDPRLAKTGDSPISGRGDGSKASDFGLHRPQSQPVPSDPRLARLAAGNLDPRLNRQNSQINQDGSGFMGNIGGAPMMGIGGMMVNQMGGPANLIGGPMGSMEPMSNLGYSKNNLSGFVNSQVGGNMNMEDAGRVMQVRGGPVNNARPMGTVMNMMGGPMNQMGNIMNQMIGPGLNLLNRIKGPQELVSNLGVLGNSNLVNVPGNSMLRVPLGQPNPQRTDLPLDPRLGNLSDPRLGNKKAQNEKQAISDPRLKSRAMGHREQQFQSKEPGFVGVDPRLEDSSKDEGFSDLRTFNNSNDQKSFPGLLRGQGGLYQSSNYLQSDSSSFGAPGQLTVSQAREGWSSNTNHKVDGDECLPQVSSSPTQYSNEDEKTAPKFDYRNDPRFRRVKRLAGQQKFSMEYSSPLGDEDGDSDMKATREQFGYNQNSYSSPRHSDRDPRNRNVPSPQLPDSLQDFDLPSSPSLTVAEPEQDLKVKDLFKTIDPTASPFC